MPELAEVEFGRKVAERVALGNKITEARAAEDDIVFAGLSAAEVQSKLRGRTVLATHRHGKYIWFELDQRPWPLFHFGMTGAFRVQGKDPLELAASPKEPDRAWPPRFTKIHLVFEGGGELVMTNARRLGRIRLLEDPRAERPVSKLGFDPYLEMPRPADFVARLTRRKIAVKALLLDQGFAAGVGNWLADEILYQAGIDPRRPANTLSEAEAKRVRAKMKAIVAKAVEVDADKTRFPRGWLFHQRWGKQAGAEVQGKAIEHIEIGGRTTAWVPDVQR